MTCSIPTPPCAPAGVGPQCFDAATHPGLLFMSSADGGKKQCLEDVKDTCDHQLKKCIDECWDDAINAAADRRVILTVSQPREDENGKTILDPSWDKIGKFGLKDQWSSGPKNITELFATLKDNRNKIHSYSDGIQGYAKRQSPYNGSYPGATNGDEMAGRDLRYADANDNVFLEQSDLVDIYKKHIEKHRRCIQRCYRNLDCDIIHCECNRLKCVFPPDVGPKDPKDTSDPKLTYVFKDWKSVNFNTTSAWGIPIEIVFGRMFLPGNLIDVSDIRRIPTVTRTITSDPATHDITVVDTRSATNRIDMRFGLCAGVTERLLTVWAEKLVIFAGLSPLSNAPAVTYAPGSETQKTTNNLGVELFGFTPAYRGLANATIRDLNIDKYTQFPEMVFEVLEDSTVVNISNNTTSFSPSGPFTQGVLFDPISAHRNYTIVGNTVSCYDADNNSLVYTKNIPNAKMVTSEGKIVTYDNIRFKINDVDVNQTFESYIPTITPNTVYLTEEKLSLTSSAQILSVVNTLGTVQRRALEPYEGTFKAVGADYTIPHAFDYLLMGQYLDTDSFTNRVTYHVGSSSTNVLITRRNQIGGLLSTFSVPLDVGESLVFVRSFSDSGAILIGTNKRARLVQMVTSLSVVWTILTTVLPVLSNQTAEIAGKFLAFIGNDGKTYNIDVILGAMTLLSAVVRPTTNQQMYNPFDNSLTTTTSTTITKTSIAGFIDSVRTLKTSLRKFLRKHFPDMLLDLDGLDLVPFIGYRSGNSMTIAEILKELSQMLLFDVSADMFLTIRNRITYVPRPVDKASFISPLEDFKDSLLSEVKTVTLTYLSLYDQGNPAKQSFTLDSDERRIRTAEISGLILLTSAGAMKLAELHAAFTVDAVETSTIQLMPRELSLTISDYTTKDLTGRVKTITIGSDLSLEVHTQYDGPGKYGEAVPTTAVYAPVSSLYTNGDLSAAVPAPFAIYTRAPLPHLEGAVSVLAGFTDTDGVTNTDATYGLSPRDSAFPGRRFRPTNPVTLGKLEALPPILNSAVYISFPTASFSVRFKDNLTAQRVVDYCMQDVGAVYSDTARLFLLGDEFIQADTASVSPSDSSVVVLTGLYRARRLTTGRYSHKIGELVVFIDDRIVDNTYDINQYDQTATGIVSVSGYRQERKTYPFRKANQLLPPRLTRPYAQLVLRPSYFTGVETINEYSVVGIEMKAVDTPNTEKFSNSLSYDPINTDITYRFYTLNAEYDSVLFDLERFNLSSTYIVHRKVVTMPAIPSGTYNSVNTPRGAPVSNVIGTNFETQVSSYYTSNPIYDQKQPTWLVAIASNEYGETRCVFDCSSNRTSYSGNGDKYIQGIEKWLN
jgi:hypothetical protein